jgi:hypothetical protein
MDLLGRLDHGGKARAAPGAGQLKKTVQGPRKTVRIRAVPRIEAQEPAKKLGAKPAPADTIFAAARLLKDDDKVVYRSVNR